MSAMIELINSNLSDAINKNGYYYKSILGDVFFTPAGSITQSSDYNCGAAANELEYARLQMQNLTKSLDPGQCNTDLLDMLVNSLINLPRNGSAESDATYLNRFRAIVRQNTNPSRCTRSAIIDALTDFGLTPESGFHVLERFPIKSKYFEIRLIGVTFPGISVLFLNHMTKGYIDNEYIGGLGVGSLQQRVMAIIQRIKAGGVQFSVITVTSATVTKTSNATITS